MGATRPFRQAVKCGRERIAPATRHGRSAPLSGSAEDDRDRSVVDELDAHPGAEDACRDRNAVAGKGGAEALDERLATSGRAASEKLGRFPLLVSASSVN